MEDEDFVSNSYVSMIQSVGKSQENDSLPTQKPNLEEKSKSYADMYPQMIEMVDLSKLKKSKPHEKQDKIRPIENESMPTLLRLA
jgi:hypothetical protein